MNWTENKSDGFVEWFANRDNLIFVVESDLSGEYIARVLKKISDGSGYPVTEKRFPTLDEAKEWCENASFNWI